MASARREVVQEGIRAVYHCTARCVRRAFLCGVDHYSGKNYEHRRSWFRNRLKTLSKLFTIDILAYAAMTNHHHEVIRTRPDLAAALTDEEVVRRWMGVFPKRRIGTPEEIQEAIEREVRNTLLDTQRVEALRKRLCSVSWFMKSLNEYIARRGNAEDEVTGRFWEGRFTCQRLEDDAAILACMAYVDLNPVRAKMADSLLDSDFTSVYDRIRSTRIIAQQEALLEGIEKTESPSVDGPQNDDQKVRQADSSWLVDLDGPDRPIAFVSEQMYFKIVDETGRRIRGNKRGSISHDVLPILEALDIDAERWTRNVEHYGSLFYRVAGTVQQLKRMAAEAGKKWFAGRKGAEALFRPPLCDAA